MATDDIVATTDLAKFDVADLSLSATNIGGDNRSLRLIQDADEIDIAANGNVYLKSLEGNNFDQFVNTGSGTLICMLAKACPSTQAQQRFVVVI